ncbi:flagellar assembly protein H [Helicobacter sp. 12S02634-8]|uniref:flagellar assembly protein FliH n=1 Tax=Helicobacter sp. 12S02634-8 TaxID=1476199 RepID=UPI000BCEE0BD|nr:flagellar assembly protein FliH [Helicobacter sp. 12S02634-8]PAF47324.1 flagellar assembly protein H [Helicobacter sp. 12S02634-8]
MSLSNFEEENLIVKSELPKHNVQKYEFKSIAKNLDGDFKEEVYAPKDMPLPVQDFTENKPTSAAIAPSLEKDLIERLLQKTDELSSNLAKLQIQFEKQQIEMEERVNTARNEAYKDGLKEGEEKTKKELLASVEKEKTNLVHSMVTFDKEMQKSQKNFEKLEKELSAIALDIAKEVIIKEVEADSQKIAFALSKELLSQVMEATDIHIKVNTMDYPYLVENLKDTPKIKIEADGAITKGGVVVVCDNGTIDGSLMARYKTLKQSVLDNLKA